MSLAGHNYVVDTSFEPYRRDAFRHRHSIPPQREGIQVTNIPGEGTINPDGLWRRGMDDWLLGAGQTYLDRKLSVNNRYYQSKGVNPWTQWNLTLHHDVIKRNNGDIPIQGDEQAGTQYSGFIKAIQAGGYVYILTASELVCFHEGLGHLHHGQRQWQRHLWGWRALV